MPLFWKRQQKQPPPSPSPPQLNTDSKSQKSGGISDVTVPKSVLAGVFSPSGCSTTTSESIEFSNPDTACVRYGNNGILPPSGAIINSVAATKSYCSDNDDNDSDMATEIHNFREPSVSSRRPASDVSSSYYSSAVAPRQNQRDHYRHHTAAPSNPSRYDSSCFQSVRDNHTSSSAHNHHHHHHRSQHHHDDHHRGRDRDYEPHGQSSYYNDHCDDDESSTTWYSTTGSYKQPSQYSSASSRSFATKPRIRARGESRRHYTTNDAESAYSAVDYRGRRCSCGGETSASSMVSCSSCAGRSYYSTASEAFDNHSSCSCCSTKMNGSSSFSSSVAPRSSCRCCCEPNNNNNNTNTPTSEPHSHNNMGHTCPASKPVRDTGKKITTTIQTVTYDRDGNPCGTTTTTMSSDNASAAEIQASAAAAHRAAGGMPPRRVPLTTINTGGPLTTTTTTGGIQPASPMTINGVPVVVPAGSKNTSFQPATWGMGVGTHQQPALVGAGDGSFLPRSPVGTLQQNQWYY